METYDHTQRGPLYLILLAMGVALLVVPWFLPWGLPLILIWAGAAVVLILLSFSFLSLRVHDEGDRLAIRFGPIPIVRRRIPYAQITEVKAGRSLVIDGWGVHCIVGRGWTFNIWGFDCVVLRLGTKTVRIGTDDVAGLEQFLKEKVG